MTKATWKGFITFGQLGLPVRLYQATKQTRPKFVQLHEKDGSPTERPLYCKVEDKEIPYSETVKAIETEFGKYLVLTDRELERKTTGQIKAISIKQFCNPNDLELMYIEKPFYIVPGSGGERAYALFREVFVRSNKIAITDFILYGKKHLGALTIQDDLLVLIQLRYSDEIVARYNIKTPPIVKPSPKELDTFNEVVKQFSSRFYINDYHDEYTEELYNFIERKIKGLPEIRPEKASLKTTPENEIVSTLEKSLE